MYGIVLCGHFMVLYCVVMYGIVLCGHVWYGMVVVYGMVWYGVAQNTYT